MANGDFHYAGMNFVGHYDDLHDIAHWCWTKISVSPEEIEVTYQDKTRSDYFPHSK
jgi:hypothetical protein